MNHHYKRNTALKKPDILRSEVEIVKRRQIKHKGAGIDDISMEMIGCVDDIRVAANLPKIYKSLITPCCEIIDIHNTSKVVTI